MVAEAGEGGEFDLDDEEDDLLAEDPGMGAPGIASTGK